MYEIVEVANGWLVCWGPPPADAAAPRPKTPPAAGGGRPAVPASAKPSTNPRPAAASEAAPAMS